MKKLLVFVFVFFVGVGMFAQEKIQTEAGLKTDFIYMNGNIGIGSNNPSSKLDVNNGILTIGNAPLRILSEQIRLGRPNSTIRYHSIYSNHSDAEAENVIQFKIHNGGMNSPYTNQKTILTMNGQGNVGIGTTAPTSALNLYKYQADVDIRLQNSVTSWWLRNDAYKKFIISGQNSGDVFVINDNNGNVGIGTNAPSRKLVVNGPSNYADNLIIMRDGGSDLNNAIKFENETEDIYIGASFNNEFAVGFSPDLGGASKFKVNSNGYVGIGVNSPGKFLDVNNSIRIRGDVSTLNFYRTTGPIDIAHIEYNQSNSEFSFAANNKDLVFISKLNFEESMRIKSNGNLLIGKTTQTNSTYKLDVNGKARANEIVVNTDGADFVFEDTYKLRKLEEVESFIKENKHLPEIASAEEMQKNGVGVGELNTKLLQKVEELTLYAIEQNKKTKEQSIKIKEQEKVLKEQSEKIKVLEEEKTEIANQKTEIESLKELVRVQMEAIEKLSEEVEGLKK